MFSFDSLQEAVAEPVAETEVLDAMEELQVLLQSSEPTDPGGAGQQQLFLARLAAVQLAVRRCEGLACNVELERGLVPALVSLVTHHRIPTQPEQDFYHGQVVGEAELVRPLLAGLAQRLGELLLQFPGNPVLEQVERVRARVAELPQAAPLSQLTTGLELLLAAGQQWQQAAHSGVSLQPELDTMSEMVLRWRRMELTGWRSLLAASLEKARQRTRRQFWPVVAAAALEHSSAAMVQTLVKFMEAASLADFRARLLILHSVGTLLRLLGRSKRSTAALANLHTYYTDLETGVERALQERTAAAECKVKELMKVVRWKDTSFWSVKAVVEKTRKTLHKTLREFQKAFSAPCRSYFSEISVTEQEGAAAGPGAAMKDLVCSTVWRGGPGCGGRLAQLDKRAARWSGQLLSRLAGLELVTELQQLLPALVTEIDSLRGLAVEPSKPEKERKKQAGFIQQRKRAGLNNLFKTLQDLGFSYRYGLSQCGQLDSCRELFTRSEIASPAWDRSEKYFFRCFSRFRRLMAALQAHPPPPDLAPCLAERFHGFARHLLHLAVVWRETASAGADSLHRLEVLAHQLEPGQAALLNSRHSGAELRILLHAGLDSLDSCLASLHHRQVEYPELENLPGLVASCQQLRTDVLAKIADSPGVFILFQYQTEMTAWTGVLEEIIRELESCIAAKKYHPVSSNFKEMSESMQMFRQMLDSQLMARPPNTMTASEEDFKVLLDKLVVRSLLGIQNSFKKSNELIEDSSWVLSMNKLIEMYSFLEVRKMKSFFERVTSALDLMAGNQSSQRMLDQSVDVFLLIEKYLEPTKSIQNILEHSLLNLNKLLSVVLKVFTEIAEKGFCPVQESDDEQSKNSNEEFKSSEEETGLGKGEGSNDVSDQIDNEDMLDGAYEKQEDANESEDKDNKEEDNGIEMSENFDSNQQDKNDQNENDEDDGKEDDENLDDETGEVDGNEDLDKEMWGDENDKDNDQDMDKSDEKGKTDEEDSNELAAKEECEKSDERRKRKEEREEDQEFDDDQKDNEHGKDKQLPEAEAFDLPDNMELDDKEQQDNFEENGSNDPDTLPDFEDEENKLDEEDIDESQGNPDVEMFEAEEEEKIEEQSDRDQTDEKELSNEENSTEQDKELENQEDEKIREESGMDVDENSKTAAIENNSELDQDNKNNKSEGINDDQSSQSTEKSFGVVGNEDEMEKPEKDDESGSGKNVDQLKSLSENFENVKRLDIVDGSATGEEKQSGANLFQHVDDHQDDDQNTTDQANEKDIKSQTLPDSFDLEPKEEKEKEMSLKTEEDKVPHEKNGEKVSNPREEPETESKERTKVETTGDFVSTLNVGRGTDSLISSGLATPSEAVQGEPPELANLSLEPVELLSSGECELPVQTELSHQLCEQLRLILEPTKAAKLQGDFRTGKRLNMRKIIPYIASQFKKDKIWLRRVKPNKREFQILVGLDDSSSMSDNKSREIALSSLNTISSALALLEVGQLGVLRFGQKAEVVHPLGSQWSQAAGHTIQNQFSFDQKETSLVSLLGLASQLFTSAAHSTSRSLSVSQLLVILSDGRGVFHEGRERVMQSVRRARQVRHWANKIRIIFAPSRPLPPMSS